MKAYSTANFTIIDYEKYPAYQKNTLKTLSPYFQSEQAKVIVSASGELLGTKEGGPL